MPSVVHRNYIDDWCDENTIIDLGFGGWYKISKRIDPAGEYYHRFKGHEAVEISDSFPMSFAVETGGHIF